MSRNIDACWAVAAAAVQIGLAMREAEPAVEQLAACLGRMAQRLRAKRARTANAGGSVGAGDVGKVDAELDLELEKGLMSAIIHMQFYDRVAQHLAHIEKFMAGAARQLTSGNDADEHAWQALCEDLRSRLTSQTHQVWLDALWARGGGAAHNPSRPIEDHAAAGAVEFFYPAGEGG